MRLTIHRGENIGAQDQETSFDTYVRVVYDGKEVGITHVVRRAVSPVWDMELWVPLQESWDMNVAFISFDVKCSDDSAHGECLASCRVNLSLMQGPKEPTQVKCQLIRGSTVRCGWLYISMQMEEAEVLLFSKAKRVDVRDVLPPHNERFQHHYAPIPRVWHPLHDCVVPSNEKILYMVEEVSLTFHVTEGNQGVLALMVVTNFRLWFIPYAPVQGLHHEDVHTIPLGKIAKLTQTQSKQKQFTVHGLTMENMDASLYSVTLNARLRAGDSEAKRVRMLTHIVNEIEWLQMENNFCAFTDLNIVESHPEANVTTEHPVGISPMTKRSFLSDGASAGAPPLLYEHSDNFEPFIRNRVVDVNRRRSHTSSFDQSLQLRLASPTATSAANKRRIRYDPLAEFSRQGVFSHPAWRQTTVNAHYGLCPSYPSFLLVPASVPDDILAEAARFRSKRRHPALTWLHPRTGAPLCRSSQPKSGVLRTSSKEDRDLLWAIRDAAYPVDGRSKQSTLVHIVDCRPEINAKSNALAGKGHESAKHYDRDGYPCASIAFMGIDNIHVVRASFNQLSQALYQVDDATFHSTLQKSRWLEHINSILAGAVEVASHLERGDAVLVHCSDGWDRTAQLCALAQLMLDPYFRTIEGFATLVEKDWCSFGHNFAKRCGFPVTDDTSPVFQQFLDAVYQLTLQFPTHFQFNEMFLSSVADAVYSSWFGTFQKNCEADRAAFLCAVPTISVWDTIRASTDMYRNPLYNTDTDDAMVPVCRVRLMQLWASQHQKAISHMRLQQREVEMLALIRQQERELTRLRDLLTPEQHLEVKNAQLRSEIQRLARKIAIHHEHRLSSSVSSTPTTTPEKAKLLRRLTTTVASPTHSAPVHGASSSSLGPPSLQPADLHRTRSGSGRVKQGLAALLTGRPQVNDITTLRNEYQDLTRHLESMRSIARSLDEDAYSTMQQLRFQNYNTPLEEGTVASEPIKQAEDTQTSTSFMLSPSYFNASTAPPHMNPVVTAALSTSFTTATRPHVSLLAMTDFNAPPQSAKGPRPHSMSTSRAGNSNVQPVWELDKDAACCKQCKKKFIAVVRNRHHCRCCGYVFCGKCTSHRMSLPEFGYFELVRVCRVCFNSSGGADDVLQEDFTFTRTS
ncbi:hypothetical protein H310_06653 [Aphanomyces invadans]|uniref:phosphatidylinositol-3,5-bisphosphate 3-phosphatase n=1 Tax=Aphanomyces invadans TaxID=157072 RepID=A0A024U5Z2_9STRA|nr:hypothetical protein H310_06653 [Aphanomyces invadans]ETW01018.1 hypothetical protein H310_06653 [Aphanomyces invadans]|eukprot:XP_008870016.1 hypothetical protein H310_06653 [Aphanomyces invadans]